MRKKELPEELQYMMNDIDTRLPFALFDFETNKGWDSLILNLLMIISIIDKNKCVRITQVKEKFAGLRFYYSWNGEWKKKSFGNSIKKLINKYIPYKIRRLFKTPCLSIERLKEYEQISDLIRWFEDISMKICENCGEPGRVRNDLWWILTLCDKCYLDHTKKEETKYRDFKNDQLLGSGHFQSEDI